MILDVEKAQQTKEAEKSRIRARYKGVDKNILEVIPAIPNQRLNEDTSYKRVAVYARVSTDDPRQTSSYELQRNHYEEMVREHPGWELVDIYADEGISGTSMEHRESFQRLMEDCRAGKIDLVVTKSISRFARNIVDCISNIRELAHLPKPVGILFETEHMFTLDGTTEMMLAVLSAAAQEESHTKSEIMNISIEQRFSRGIFLTPPLLGYDKDNEGNLIINDEEAETVKVCFYMTIFGYSASEIADKFTAYKRRTKTGLTRWSRNSITDIIRNERYCGDILSRKTYTPNYLDHKARKNRQNRNQYLQRDHHEPIVEREIFNAANRLLLNYKCRKAGKPLPLLKVIKYGLLTGYVPVESNWQGFRKDDFDMATLSAENHIYITDKTRSNSFPGYYVVRKIFFPVRESPSMWVSENKMFFSSTCLNQFNDVEYIELLYNSSEGKIAVRPTREDNPNAIHWGKKTLDKWRSSTRSCSGFAKPLFEKMGWNSGCRYRIRGHYMKKNNQQVLIFNLKEYEVMTKSKDNGRGRYVMPDTLKTSYGQPYDEYCCEYAIYNEKADYYARAEEVPEYNTIDDNYIEKLKTKCDKVVSTWGCD